MRQRGRGGAWCRQECSQDGQRARARGATPSSLHISDDLVPVLRGRRPVQRRRPPSESGLDCLGKLGHGGRRVEECAGEGGREGERRNRLILMPRGVHLARSLGWSAERQVKELHFLSLPLSLHIRIGRPQNPLSAMRINHMHRADSCLFE